MRNLAIMNDHAFHLVTLQEYILSQGEKLDDWLVVIYHNVSMPKLKVMCKAHLDRVGFKNYGFVDYRILKRVPLVATVALQVARVMRYLLFQARKLTFNTVAVGNYTSRVCQSVVSFTKSQRLVYLDEGHSTIGVAKTRTQPAAERSAFSNFLRLLPTFRGNKAVTFFTRYAELTFAPTDSILLCDYSHTLRKEDAKSVDSGSVIFLGNPWIEKDYVGEEQYFRALLAIHNNYLQEGITMRYKPHRSESSANLKRFASAGVYIVTDTWPIELYLMRLELFPLHIASFVTSALATISTLFGQQIGLVAYELTDEANPNFDAHFKEMYAYYRDNEDSLRIAVRPIPYRDDATIS